MSCFQGSPEFDASASNECNLVFKWETSYACPVGGSTSGGKGTCMVKDPVSQYTFNLSPLRRSSGFYQVKSGADTYIINICGNVSGSGCNKLGPGFEAAACKFNGQGKSSPTIGSLSKQLTYSMGQITLKYRYIINALIFLMAFSGLLLYTSSVFYAVDK